jgi:dephospho-CoA kinase
MVRMAVTGGIACGKSTVGAILAERGIPVCEADLLAHAEMQKGRPVFRAVVEAFGDGILDASGQIDRAGLGRQVFSDPEKLTRLNRLVHPAVREAWRRWLDEREGDCCAAAVVIPLLYEVKEDQGWDAVVCVSSRTQMQLARLQERGLTEAEARSRMAAQMPLAAKMERADYVICNYGTIEILKEQAELVARAIYGE